MIRRRQVLQWSMVAPLAWVWGGVRLATAQNYPARPVTLVVPWPAGGAVDTVARLIGPKLAERLRQPVIIENKAGAASTLGVASVARAIPDGYTLVIAGSSSLAVGATVYKKLSYDPRKDFSPIAVIAQVPMVLVVNSALPVQSVSDFVKFAKERPNLSYASGGPGGPHHLFMELLKTMTGLEITHVPYKGNAPAVADVMAGHVPVMFSDATSALPLIRAGKLRALGISSTVRLSSAPDIPPISEAGLPGFDGAAWMMVVAPANNPKPITTRLRVELEDIITTSEINEQMVQMGLIPVTSSPEDLQSFIDSEIDRWRKVVERAGIAGSQ